MDYKLWLKAHENTASGRGKKLAKNKQKGVDIWGMT
jgi:hypothetical protein